MAALSVEGVKLDRTFAMAPNDSMMARMIVHALDIVKTSGRTIVVEGVETLDRLELLRRTKQVDYVQGYLIARPLPIDAFAQFLATYIGAAAGRRARRLIFPGSVRFEMNRRSLEQFLLRLAGLAAPLWGSHANRLLLCLAALLEISSCFAFWIWARLNASPLWLIPGVVGLIGFAWALTKIDSDQAGRTLSPLTAASTSSASLIWMWAVEGKVPDRWDIAGSAHLPSRRRGHYIRPPRRLNFSNPNRCFAGDSPAGEDMRVSTHRAGPHDDDHGLRPLNQPLERETFHNVRQAPRFHCDHSCFRDAGDGRRQRPRRRWRRLPRLQRHAEPQLHHQAPAVARRSETAPAGDRCSKGSASRRQLCALPQLRKRPRRPRSPRPKQRSRMKPSVAKVAETTTTDTSTTTKVAAAEPTTCKKFVPAIGATVDVACGAN